MTAPVLLVTSTNKNYTRRPESFLHFPQGVNTPTFVQHFLASSPDNSLAHQVCWMPTPDHPPELDIPAIKCYKNDDDVHICQSCRASHSRRKARPSHIRRCALVIDIINGVSVLLLYRYVIYMTLYTVFHKKLYPFIFVYKNKPLISKLW